MSIQHRPPEDCKTVKPSPTASHAMDWSIKTSTTTPSDKQMIYGLFWGIPIAVCIFTTWNMWDSIAESLDTWLLICLPSMIIGLAFVAIFMQKTAFNYNIYLDHGEVNHQLYFPDFAGGLFKSIAAVAIVFFALVAILTGSLLFLLGPAAVAACSAIKLMNWEKPPIEYEKSLPWNQYNFVTVDRKYRIIVTHHTTLTFGFEARFPNKDLFEQYLAFIRTVVAPHAEFTEKVWKW